MPVNKSFRIRVEILDELLGSLKKRTTEELMQDLNERLSDNGYKPISRKTFYNDLGYLESDLGAPIKRASKSDRFICYSEKFSIKNIPIDDEDVSLLRQAIEILKRATDLNIIKDIENIVSKLENKVHTNVPNNATMIAFEEHTKALGQEHLDNIFNAIVNKSAIKVKYKPFSKEVRDWLIHPYMLKEYRNRWFLIGKRSGSDSVINLALDRIQKINNSDDTYEENTLFDPDSYFNNVIGVTFPEERKLEKVILKVYKGAADYVMTKPIHKTQEVVKTYSDGSIQISLTLYINFELKSYLMSYGNGIEVIKPLSLRKEISALFEDCSRLYH
jgi:predicted DNA-binding transcriptional regulator YafY